MLELYSGHIRSKCSSESRGCRPFTTLPTYPILSSVFLTSGPLLSFCLHFQPQHPGPSAICFSFLSPGHPTLVFFSLSFPLNPNQCRHLPALCHHPESPHPLPPSLPLLLLSVFLSLLLSFQGPIRAPLSTQPSQRLGGFEMK